MLTTAVKAAELETLFAATAVCTKVEKFALATTAVIIAAVQLGLLTIAVNTAAELVTSAARVNRSLALKLLLLARFNLPATFKLFAANTIAKICAVAAGLLASAANSAAVVATLFAASDR